MTENAMLAVMWVSASTALGIAAGVTLNPWILVLGMLSVAFIHMLVVVRQIME